MPSVSYGNTLTDLGRNIAEQKASEQALAGILAQVGAQKLAALNALAANRGRTQAERDVGMDRNATQRQVAVMESMLRAQELGDRDRQSREGLAAAEAIARLQGANQLAVAQTPYGPEALKMTEAIARLNLSQLNPRVAETMFTENAERERQNMEAQNIASDANRLASVAFQEFQRRSGSWTPFTTDKAITAEYNNAIGAILQRYGDKASLLRTVPRPGGKIEFEALQLPIIRPQVPQVPAATGTGSAAAIPPPNMAVPVPPTAVAPPTGPMAVPQTGWPTGNANAIPETFAVPSMSPIPGQPTLSGEATGLAAQSRSIIANSPFKELIPPSVFSDPSVRGGRRYGARTPEEQESVLRDYVGNLIRESARLSGMPANRGSAQRAQLLQSELARVKAILSSR